MYVRTLLKRIGFLYSERITLPHSCCVATLCAGIGTRVATLCLWLNMTLFCCKHNFCNVRFLLHKVAWYCVFISCQRGRVLRDDFFMDAYPIKIVTLMGWGSCTYVYKSRHSGKNKIVAIKKM